MTEHGPLRLVVFDLDGTLVDSGHTITAAMARAFEASALEAPAPDAVRRVVGLALTEAIARLAPDQAAEAHDEIGARYKRAFVELREAGAHPEALYPGVPEALAALEAEGWLLGIATGKSARGLAATLDRFGLRRHFVTLQTAESGPGKPAPDMLHRALAEAGVGAEAAVMVGDTSYDMAMARAAGVPGIGVAWGYHEAAELTAAGARHVIDDFADLPARAAGVLTAAAGKGGVPGGSTYDADSA